MSYRLMTCRKDLHPWKEINFLRHTDTGGKMPKRKTEKSLEEIITEAEKSFEKTGRRRRLMIFISLLIFILILLYGYVMVRQKMLDLDAEAYIQAVQTATARAKEQYQQPPVSESADKAEELLSTLTPEPE